MALHNMLAGFFFKINELVSLGSEVHHQAPWWNLDALIYTKFINICQIH